MSGTDSNSQSMEAENSLHTEVKVYKTTYLWTVDNFDFFEERGEIIKSPVFSSPTIDEIKWYISLKPNGEKDSKDTISLYLYLKEKGEYEKVSYRLSFCIIDKDQKEAKKLTTRVVSIFSTGFGWATFCAKDKYFRENLLSNNALKIFGELTFSPNSASVVEQHSYRNTSTPFLKPTTANSVADDLNAVLNSHLLSDVVLSANNKEYPAHKTILAAGSKVFAAMFQQGAKENQLNRIDIDDMGEEALGEMLRFMYTGKCEKLDEMAESLLIAADKYELESLKMVCSQVLYGKLSVGNAAKTLILADSHKADKLKNEVIKFIITEPIGVFSTDEWKLVLNNSQLMDEVCRFLVCPKGQDHSSQNGQNSITMRNLLKMSPNILKSWFLRVTNRNS